MVVVVVLTCGHDSIGGRVPIEEITDKVKGVIENDQVMSVAGSLATSHMKDRQFTCCIHSDLPGKEPPKSWM